MATNYYDRWGNLQGEIPSAPGRTLAYMVEEHAEANGVTVKYICLRVKCGYFSCYCI